MPSDYLQSFADELVKIASKKKISGMVTLDRNAASRALKSTQTRPNRGPHPALNYEHSR